ncbi:hypothetical protein LOTGIDRAFT_152873 [Lottia gigantea]|uniref:Uncharacterized protein n=1 Tax=Lottia gigantea TaxID=225164 RepID=V4AKW0_LOTGI|nr:hypothetical protein LOTGIDRAFT_152873 [Lottia gigantea]ESO97777.1 hypothetical protein LOTGIDRAFT_152873 [Lottia gigantea]
MADVANLRENLMKRELFDAPAELHLPQKKKEVKLDNEVTDKTGKKKRQNVKHEKSSKKTKRHEPVINNLLQQGWSVINQSRYQITVVKLPEVQTKLKTAIEKRNENCSERTDFRLGVSREKKTLLQRFVKRYQKVIERCFTCGKKED